MQSTIITEEQWDTIRSNMSDAIDHLNVLVGQAADAFAESVRVWHARGAGLPPLTVNNVKGSAGDPVIAMIKEENGYRVQAWNGVSVYDYDVGPDGRYPHNHPRYSIDLAGLLSRAIVASLTPDPRAEKIEADADETRRLKGDVLTVREAAEAIRDQVLFTGPRDFDEYEYAVRMLLKAFEFETADEVTIDPRAPPTITAEPVALSVNVRFPAKLGG